MEAVQTLRVKAKEAGNLKTTSQITVVQQTPSTIVIQPANPQVIYVPEYNPAVVFGTPYVVPGYTAGESSCGQRAFIRCGHCGRRAAWPAVVVIRGDGTRGRLTGTEGMSDTPAIRTMAALLGMALTAPTAITVMELMAAPPITGPTDCAGAYHGYSANGVYHSGGTFTKTLRAEHQLIPATARTEPCIPAAAVTTMPPGRPTTTALAVLPPAARLITARQK